MIKVNLNEIIKVKYTDYGRDIYYHRFDDLIDRGALCLKSSYPKVDADGYSEIQLWEFMQIFGPHIRMGMTEVVTEHNSIYLDECGNDFRETVVDKEEVVEEEKRVKDCCIDHNVMDRELYVQLSYDDDYSETHIIKNYSRAFWTNPCEFIGCTPTEARELISMISVGM